MNPPIRLGDKEPWYEFWKMVFIDILYKQGLSIILLLLGPFLVALAILFKEQTDEVPKSVKRVQYKGWKFTTTKIKPLQIYVGENGFMGDHTWPNNCPSWTSPDSFFGMWLWAAFRNPVGGWDKLIGCRLTPDTKIYYYGDALVGDDGDGAGRQFVITKTPKGYYRGYYKVTVLEDDPTKCKRIRAGYKVKPYYTYEGWDHRAIDATPLSVSTKNFVRR